MLNASTGCLSLKWPEVKSHNSFVGHECCVLIGEAGARLKAQTIRAHGLVVLLVLADDCSKTFL